MGPWYYEVVSFDGDYVNLRRTDIESDELNPVALALLPPEIDVGSKLKCEYFQYERGVGGRKPRRAAGGGGVSASSDKVIRARPPAGSLPW